MLVTKPNKKGPSLKPVLLKKGFYFSLTGEDIYSSQKHMPVVPLHIMAWLAVSDVLGITAAL